MLALLSRDPASDVPTDIWPPGYNADDYRQIPASAPLPEPDPDITDTTLGRMLEENEARRARVRAA